MTEARFSLTTKVSGDLFTVRGDTAAEFQANLQAVVSESLLDYIGAVQELAAGNKTTDNISTTQTAFNATVQDTPPEPEDDPWGDRAVSTPGKMCAHGPMVYRSGVSKAGKDYKMWACQERNRDEQCKPIWVN